MHPTSICLLSTDTPHAALPHDGLAASNADGLLWRTNISVFALPEDEVASLVETCRNADMQALVDIDPTRFPIDHDLVAQHPHLFALRHSVGSAEPVDPRKLRPMAGEARARLTSPEAMEILCPAIAERIASLIERGITGSCLLNISKVSEAFLVTFLRAVRALSKNPDVLIFADLTDVPGGTVSSLADMGVNFGVLPFARWDHRELTSAIEYRAANPGLPLIGAISSKTSVAEAAWGPVASAVATGRGIVIPTHLLAREEPWPRMVAQAIALTNEVAAFPGDTQCLTGAGASVTALLHSDAVDAREVREALLVLINSGSASSPVPDLAMLAPMMRLNLEALQPVGDGKASLAPMARGEVRLFTAQRAVPITLDPDPAGLPSYAQGDRLVLEDVQPTVDGGDFAVRRVVGESVVVTATMFADGHEQLAAELYWRASDESAWQRVRMEQLPNDLWQAPFPLKRLGRYEYRVEGWLDRFGGFRRDLTKKLNADLAQPVDYAEGRVLIDDAVARAGEATRGKLIAKCKELDAVETAESAADLLLSDELAALMDAVDERPHRIRSMVQRVDAERLAARFSSWYELFPRSQTDDPRRHGTFADVIERLPSIRAMGFDTLYFPPIHPIGQTNRKGPNNSLIAGPEDPGSPYAIGAAEGGHDALHPQLGSFEDFTRLIDAAQAHGLEIALDFAVQCSPDHPWLREHPGWFAWRPDGSMKYAENPPKKYQDIVNVDFYGPDAVPGLWIALRDVVLLWVRYGVKVFRVDNPHTKPLPFWEWMIGEVRCAHPDVIFLAEAFTRPAMMYRLAKIGFSQSYTYFTWRDAKAELVEYVTELTTTAPKEFYRPHFFVNTPDINPPFLQTSGKPGFRIRAVLAATLSGLFGVYSGFELCEAAPVPGKEEYLDSEKYEIRPRDWNAPGNIIADITLLNRLRRSYPALQTHLNTRFQVVHNAQVIYYAKPAPDGADMILVMVSLDPHNAQEADFEVPLWEFGIPDDGSIAVEDLAQGHRFRWQGKFQHIRLDPAEPYRIWRIAPGEAV